MTNEYVTGPEIGKIREIMGLNMSQFAQAVGAGSGQVAKNWEQGKCRPTGDRYERLLLLKKQYLKGKNKVASEQLPLTEAVPAKIQSIAKIYDLATEYNKLNVEGQRLFKALVTQDD